MKFPGFIGGSNTLQSLVADAERTVNLYVEQTQSEGARTPVGLMPSPGFKAWCTVPDIGGRGFTDCNGRLFGVMGGRLNEFTDIGGFIDRGAVAQDSNPAQLIFNGVIGGQLGICTGGNVYCFTLATNTLVGPLLQGGYTHLVYSDGRGLALNPTTGKVSLSDLNDLSTWDPGSFFQRSKFPDPWQALWTDPNGLLWLPGTETFEVWYNANPASTQPYAPLQGLVGRHGIIAPFAYWVSGKSMGWLAKPEGGATVITTKGAAPQDIATYAVNNAIASYRRTSRITDADAMVYQQQGHTFVALAFPSAPATWVFDVETHSWSERGRWDPTTGSFQLWAPRVHIDAYGKQLIGDRTTGTIWEMRTDLATEIDGTPIVRLRRAVLPPTEDKRVPIDRLQIIMDTGVADQNIDPVATLRISGDGARTWSNERQAGYGPIGRYRQRMYWDRLGAPEEGAIECRWSSPAPARIVAAHLNNVERA